MSRFRSSPALATWCLAASGVVTSQVTVAATRADLDTTLDYQADAACPGRDRFLALVDSAIDPPQASPPPATQGLRMRVEIRAAAGGYRGSMEKIDRSGPSEPRVVVSPSCGEVAQALALTAAFSLTADEGQPVSVPPSISVEGGAPPAPPAQPTSDPVAATGAWLAALGASGGSALSMDLLTGIEGSGGRTFPVGGNALPLFASVRLRTTYARNDWTGGSPVARFALWTAALEACALPRPFGFGIELGLCASAESGWLRGRGVRIANPRTTDSLWLALGGGPLVRLPLGPRWNIEARGAALRPLRRAHFSFASPDAPVADTPAVTWTAALALVARFP